MVLIADVFIMLSFFNLQVDSRGTQWVEAPDCCHGQFGFISPSGHTHDCAMRPDGDFDIPGFAVAFGLFRTDVPRVPYPPKTGDADVMTVMWRLISRVLIAPPATFGTLVFYCLEVSWARNIHWR